MLWLIEIILITSKMIYLPVLHMDCTKWWRTTLTRNSPQPAVSVLFSYFRHKINTLYVKYGSIYQKHAAGVLCPANLTVVTAHFKSKQLLLFAVARPAVSLYCNIRTASDIEWN